MLNPKWTKYVVQYFRSDLLNVLSLAIDFEKLEEIEHHGIDNVKNSIALGQLLELHPDSERYVLLLV